MDESKLPNSTLISVDTKSFNLSFKFLGKYCNAREIAVLASATKGGRREGAGRPVGSPNKATRQQGARLSELAKSYTDIAFSTLLDVAMNGSSDTARIAAANSILDRGYGKPKADVEEVVDLPAIVIQRAQ